ncbi:SSU ribosomal protein S9p (S16e) [Olavius algarvensis associated proteobacterium Delta 3]|nr:SSU ribosomal protein S9p (S16e) [Olavius algarvensis associated proteobacterium Delta 3]CAB5133666.1 SSU ribosomal protein S9p (S16e) [Olavius algarvensis associated proteobacterium Delta 3]
MDTKNTYYATGKRKSAIARTWITTGNGTIMINNKPIDEYFKIDSAKATLTQPLTITNTRSDFDVKVRVIGGGITGQAGAIRHGITKALMLANPDLRQPLKRAGFVRRDPRVKERKKYGQRGARARFQFSKR